MTKRRRGPVRRAALAPQSTPTAGPATLADLEAVRDDLAALDAQRRRLVARRDSLVQTLRAGGATWPQLVDAAGASRPALVKRGGGGLQLNGTRREMQ